MYQKDHNRAVMDELGILPLSMSVVKSTLKYLSVNEVMSDRPLLCAAVEEDKSLVTVNHGERDWKRSLRSIIILKILNTRL